MARAESDPDVESNAVSTTTDGDVEQDADSDDASATEHEECHETVPPSRRAEVLDRDGHRCQMCGRTGPQAGGLATLHVHHIERDPEDVDVHDPANLTTLCQSCHTWHHQQATEEDAPVELSEADLSVLLPQDIEILRVLNRAGPLKPGDIAATLTAELSVMAVRERLWVLMGLDNIVETRDQQIVEQDVRTRAWGLIEQIETPARGRIPEEPRLLRQRIEDEQVRRALERGCSREMIGEVLGITRRTTFYKEKRAHAYDFPMDAVAVRGGRPPENAEAEEDESGETSDGRDGDGDAATQQRLDTVTGGANDTESGSGMHGGTERGRAEQSGVSGSAADAEAGAGSAEMRRDGEVVQDAASSVAGSDDMQELRAQLAAVIEAVDAVVEQD